MGAIPASLHSCGSRSLPNTTLLIADLPSCFLLHSGGLAGPYVCFSNVTDPSQTTAFSQRLPLARDFSCCSNASRAVIFNDVLTTASRSSSIWVHTSQRARLPSPREWERLFSRRYICLQKCQQILISADKIWGEVPSLDDIFGSSLNIFPFCYEHGIGDVSTISISNRNLSHCDWRTLKSSHL